MQGRLVKSCSIGGFPKPDGAIWEAPEALRQLHGLVARKVGAPPGEIVYTVAWMRGRWVFPRARIVYTIARMRGRRV